MLEQSPISFPPLVAQINSFASWLYNFLKLLVSKIIISHFYKISLNGRWQVELRKNFLVFKLHLIAFYGSARLFEPSRAELFSDSIKTPDNY